MPEKITVNEAVEKLVQVARFATNLANNGEELFDGSHHVENDDYMALCNALDDLDSPDTLPLISGSAPCGWHQAQHYIANTKKEEQYILQEIRCRITDLEDDGIEDFFGHWVPYVDVINRFIDKEGNTPGYGCDPLEMIDDLICERDVLKEELQKHKDEAGGR